MPTYRITYAAENPPCQITIELTAPNCYTAIGWAVDGARAILASTGRVADVQLMDARLLTP